MTRGKRRAQKNKEKRKRRALRNEAKNFGLGNLYFRSCRPFGPRISADLGRNFVCFTKKYIDEHDVIYDTIELRKLLSFLEFPEMFCGSQIKISIYFIDDDIEFGNLTGLKKHLLIKKLAGIW